MASSTSKSALFAPIRADGRYEVGALIATGGMGTVYRAFDRLGQRPVAYKRLLVGNESRMAALFQREFDTLRGLAHPNIVEAYDFGFDDQGPFYTMELLTGDDLSKLAPLPVPEACRLLRDVASALALLHARRLVHRDVSPKNVFRTAQGQAKLIDFGALTPFGTPAEIVGTPAFIAPESLTNAALDQRTDLYALGALAYWALTRRTHLHARHIDDLPDAWQEPVSPPSRHVPGLPEALDELVLALLDANPAARPASAADVIEQLTMIAKLGPEQEPERVAYSYLQHPPLIGREHAMGTVTRALSAALGGAGQLVLLEAGQGLGRTAVLDQIAVQAQVAGATVLRAGAGQHTAPFSAAHHLVHTGLATFPALASRMRERSSQFVQLLEPSGSKGALVRTTVEASERQAGLSSLLSEALFELSEHAPLVLLVDDAQGVDVESLATLASLFGPRVEPRAAARSAAEVNAATSEPQRCRILLVLSARSGQAARDPQVRATLESNAERLRLPALTEAQLGELVSTIFGGVPNCHSLSAWLYAQVAGNPAHAMDLVRLLLAQGSVRYTLGTFTLPYELAARPAQQGHAEALLASLAGLSGDARELATLLALHPGGLSPEQLARARGASTREVVLGLEQLAQRGAAIARGESYSCASEALRSVLVEAVPPERARVLHAALARALSEQAMDSLSDLLAMAHHLLSASEAEQLEAAYLLARAAKQHMLELGMIRSALPLLEAAVSILTRHGHSDEDCIGLLVPLSLAGFYGDLALQRRYLDRALGALASICGLTRARRLRRWLGPRFALVVGLIVAFVVHLVRRRTLTRRTFVEHLETLTATTGPAVAAAACSLDSQEAMRVVAWLEPLAWAPRRSPLFFMYEFSLATAELVSGKFASAAQRYAFLQSVYERPVFGIDPAHVAHIRAGCLSGHAQALVTQAAPEALALAERLEQSAAGAFFAPHAEGVRASYYAYRGDVKRAAAHRKRAEALSLRAGTCWSAMTVLTVRSVLICALAGDVIGLVRTIADLEQLASLSPSLQALYELAQAHLELLSGQPARALARYERTFAGEVARRLPTYAVERALHVQALSTLGDHARARALGLAVLEELAQGDQETPSIYCLPRQKLALAEAKLGNLSRAIELIDGCFERARFPVNPSLLGGVHRDRAYLAALAGDRAGFQEHFTAMAEQFRVTENPRLIQQCVALRAQASQLGVCAPVAASEQLPDDDLDGLTAVERSHDRRLVSLAVFGLEDVS